MLARIREVEGGYKITLLTASGEVESRQTADLAEAFRWQTAGAFPPEAKGKKK